uniref:Uncharacterized protein n=1 Tax=Oryzias latipes TaxID=8090 RepID=A0A3P9M982_ORYLA
TTHKDGVGGTAAPVGSENREPRVRALPGPVPGGGGGGGKTRTKDKHGVVYTDHQRLKLEKEFQYNRYIINRRAKERKMTRKKLQHSQQASTTTPTPPVLGGHADAHAAPSPSSNMVSDIKSEEY